MKRIFSFGFLTLAAAALFGASPAAAQQFKVGVLNSQRVLNEAPGAQAAQQEFQQVVQRYQIQLDSLEKLVQKGQTDFAQQQANLNDQAKQQRQQVLQQQYTGAQAQAQQLEQKVEQERQRLFSPIMQKVKDAVEAVRKEGNFSMIIEPPNGTVIAVDPALDVTDRVLARLKGGK